MADTEIKHPSPTVRSSPCRSRARCAFSMQDRLSFCPSGVCSTFLETQKPVCWVYLWISISFLWKATKSQVRTAKVCVSQCSIGFQAARCAHECVQWTIIIAGRTGSEHVTVELPDSRTVAGGVPAYAWKPGILPEHHYVSVNTWTYSCISWQEKHPVLLCFYRKCTALFLYFPFLGFSFQAKWEHIRICALALVARLQSALVDGR